MNFFTRSSKVNEKKLKTSDKYRKKIFSRNRHLDKIAVFEILPTKYRQHSQSSNRKFKLIKNCSFFLQKTPPQTIFRDVWNALLTSCQFFSTQSSKTNFRSMTQCPKTTNSVLTFWKGLTSAHGSTGRIQWKLDNPNPPPLPKFCSKSRK